jgi:low affinity Fe/Cu permease
MKLDELIAVTVKASNRLIDIEDLTDEELDLLHQRFAKLAKESGLATDGATAT